MSPFLIFAISLTIAYAIYYAVMITRDLYGKKEEAKSNEEVFDISNITEEEAAVAVFTHSFQVPSTFTGLNI